MILESPQIFLKKVAAWTALTLLCSGIALAQSNPGRSDGQIEMDVVHALDGSKALKDDMITAATIQGEVTLSGTVASEASSELAESIAARVAGVAKVTNHLKVGNPQAASADDQNQSQYQGQPQQQQQQTASDEPANQQRTNEEPIDIPADEAYSRQITPSQPPSPAQAAAPAAPADPAVPASQARLARRFNRLQLATQPITIPQDTVLQLRTNQSVSTKLAKVDTPIDFQLINDVSVNGYLVIPRGATLHGYVAQSKQSGAATGSAELALRLNSLDLGGQSYPVTSDEFRVKGPSNTGRTAGHMLAGGLFGTIVGCAVGRGVGCAVGAATGAAAGAGVAAATNDPNLWIPAEAQVEFRLQLPVTVQPVSADEAQRLSQGLYPGGPTLYQRPRPANYTVYGGPIMMDPYPPVYYHPYYMVGGYYYWH